MFVGYTYINIYSEFGLCNALYCEPGQSRYSLSEFNILKDKYFKTCIDSKTGMEQNCTMDVRDSYISCIDNCDLISCNDSNYGNETEIKWCKNYETKRALGNEGFIPRFDYCYNSKGLISNKSSEILTIDNENKIVLGDCTFESGELVLTR